MSISSEADMLGMQQISEAVALTLKKMRQYAQPGMTTKELDEYGGRLLQELGAHSAPRLTYGFPGWTCISVNHEVAHGIPSEKTILQEGDLVNIDVSAEMGGYWSDNGGSFVLGNDIHNHNTLVNASKDILQKAISNIRGDVKIAHIGRLIETEARQAGFRVIKNLVGHGVGRSLHEAPHAIPCYYDRFDRTRFRTNSVVAIETFISTHVSYAAEKGDGWTYTTDNRGYVAQHEHTIIITDNEPVVLTLANEIWN